MNIIITITITTETFICFLLLLLINIVITTIRGAAPVHGGHPPGRGDAHHPRVVPAAAAALQH